MRFPTIGKVFRRRWAFVRSGLWMEGLGGRQAGQGTLLSGEWDAAGRGLPERKWKRRKSARGNVAGKRMGEQELQDGQEGEGGA